MSNNADADRRALRFRHAKTLDFVLKSLPPPATILDLGSENEMGRLLQSRGYKVINTAVDLDEDYAALGDYEVDAVTAFEILEHLVGPLNVLRSITASRLFVTVPLRLWFARSYRNPDDVWDRHFHEFEPWQFDWLIEKGGFEIVRTEKWRSPNRSLGVRPLLRRLTPRWYAVEARARTS